MYVGMPRLYPILSGACGVLGSVRTLPLTALLLLALAAPASAAPVMDPLKPCYVSAQTAAGPQTEGIAIHATGFTANSLVNLSIDGQPVPDGQELQTDETGTLTLPAPVPAPFIDQGTREFPVTLTQTNDPTQTATVTSRTTALGVSVRPRIARPSKRIRFKGSGFTGAKPVYAHYVYKKKVRKTVRMARKTGTCGGWKARRPQIQIDDPKPGLWNVQFDQSKRYIDATKPNSTLESVFVRLGISVTLVRRGG